MGPAGSCRAEPARVLGGTKETHGGMTLLRSCCLPNCSSLLAHKGSAVPLRDVMGSFPLAAIMSSMLNPLRNCVARSRWPEVLWRRSPSSLHWCSSFDDPPRLLTPRPLFHFRATKLHSPDRASQSIQQALLARRRSRTASMLRRWMLPTVERGPPVHFSV
jgi:hypothetical protein